MKRFVGIVGIIWTSLWGCLWNPPGYAEIIDQIAAILDDELILRSEVRECTNTSVVKVFANLDAGEDMEQAALRYMLERRLLLREIQYLATPKEAELLKSLATQYLINTYYHQDAQAFAAKVQEYKLTDAELIPELMVYMKGLDYIRRKYRFNEDVDNPDVALKLFSKWIADLQAQARIQTSF